MKKQYKYAFVGLGFLGSAATSVYFGVRSFFSIEPPFQNTAYQRKYEGKEFIREGPSDPKWEEKYKNFSKELVDEEKIKTAFGAGVLEEYPDLLKDYKKDANSSEKIKKFLYYWCQKNRASENDDIFNLIGTWCIK